MPEYLVTLTEAEDNRIKAYMDYANAQSPAPGFPTPLPLLSLQDFVLHAIGVCEMAAYWPPPQGAL